MLVDLVADTSELNCARYWIDDAPCAPARPARRGEAASFAMPRGIWPIMFASYAIFFAAMALAAGRDGMAVMMVVISAGYTLIYFGTAALIDRVDTASRPRRAALNFDTYTGRMSYGAGFAQILTVPIMVAIFGISAAIIWAVVQ
ncbi:MAG: hypothetical protein HC788_07725 [Sphingopyxis sp.]|nr:hypothetical protein [Sphingopyxis sp.]